MYTGTDARPMSPMKRSSAGIPRYMVANLETRPKQNELDLLEATGLLSFAHFHHILSLVTHIFCCSLDSSIISIDLL